MNELANSHCEACRIDAPRVTAEEITKLLPELPGWELKVEDGVKQLHRSYKFDNFRAALAFANDVGELAEAEGHHPALLVEWGKVSVAWWSHKIRGLHKNDFVMAAKTDQLFSTDTPA